MPVPIDYDGQDVVSDVAKEFSGPGKGSEFFDGFSDLAGMVGPAGKLFGAGAKIFNTVKGWNDRSAQQAAALRKARATRVKVDSQLSSIQKEGATARATMPGFKALPYGSGTKQFS